MLSTSKFFNIVDYYMFQDLSILDRQLLLIEKSVYVEAEDPDHRNFDQKRILKEFDGNQIEFLCEPIIVNGRIYTLSKEFLSEVFINTIFEFSYYHNILDRLKSEYETSLEVNSEDKNDFYKAKYESATQEYNTSLSNDLFSELHSHRDESKKSFLRILEEYLKYCRRDLSHYLFGNNNIQGFHINSIYYTFLRLNDILDFCNLHIDIDPKSKKKKAHQSVAKIIAILNEIGFFELPLIKNLANDDDRYKVIAMLVREDYDNDNLLREIRGNVYSLNKYKSVNTDRYKAGSHTRIIKKALDDLK